MPDYELHADFDRSGSLSARASEYALRGTRPGAVAVPNLDADARALPRSVTAGRRVTVDALQPVKAARDDENLPLRIRTRRASAPAGSIFFLRILGRMKIHIEFHDTRGIILRHPPGVQDDVLFTPAAAGADLELTVEVQSIAGTPHGRSTLLDTAYRDDGTVDTRFTLELRSRAPSGTETLWDTGEFSIAPVILSDNLAPAVRMYVSENGLNAPSVAEIEAALALLRGVELVKVPPDVGGGDSWIQDQYQHALLQGADGYRQAILHLPRLRSDNAVSGAGTGANLADLVISHFPSRDVAVFDDLWNRVFVFNDAAGGPAELGFRHAHALFKALGKVTHLRGLLADRIRRFDPAWTDPGWRGWAAARSTLRDVYGILRRRIQAAVSAGRARAAEGRDYERDSRERLERIETLIPMGGGGFTLPTGRGTVTVDGRTADRLHLRINQALGSANYGGNFESSPPIGAHELGKIVVGNQHFTWLDQAYDFVDPDVFRVFHKQNKQPMVEIDTAWLHVGHVDEVVAFAPDGRNSRPGFAVLRASGLLAQQMILKARERYKAGLPAGSHPHREDEPQATALTRLTSEGTSPVTRLFRGKVWHHVHRPEAPTGETPYLEPPQIYQRLNAVMHDFGDIRYRPGESDEDRVYLADTSVREVAWCEEDNRRRSCNRFIEENFLFPIATVMEAQFPGARHFSLPVLFDRVSDLDAWSGSSLSLGTSAYTPDLVNCQVVKGRLLVPRPYGPRMRLADVRAIFAECADGLGLPDGMLARLDAGFIRRRGLHTGTYWIHPYDAAHVRGPDRLYMALTRGLLDEDDIVEQFQDSFPGASDADLRLRIIRPNRRHFRADGTLKPGWRKFEIEDDMLDLFETWTELVAAELDAPISWIDSWHYHVHGGGIHCGTNVLRLPRRGVLPDAWDAADADTRVLEFEEGLRIE